MAVLAGRTSRTSNTRRAGITLVTLCSGDARSTCGTLRASRACWASVALHALRSGIAFFAGIALRTGVALELGHGDEVCPRAAAVRAVLDVAVRHAQVHAASAAACTRHLIDGCDKIFLRLRCQVGKIADLALDRLQRHLVCRCVHIPGGLRTLVHDKVPLHHRIRAGVVGDVGVGRQRVVVLQQLVRDDGRAVIPNIDVHAAAKALILIVDLFDAVAVGDLDPPPGVPLPQRPAPVCDCDSHMMALPVIARGCDLQSHRRIFHLPARFLRGLHRQRP